jgi:hypothetical protein
MEENSINNQSDAEYASSAELFDSFLNEMGDRFSLRRIIYIGLGGFGCSIIRDLKKTIPDRVKDGFGFIGIDSHSREAIDILSDNEYIGITDIVPHEVAGQRDNRGFLDWYKKLPKGDWKANSVMGGCNQIRALGRLCFHFPPTFNRFITLLNATYNRVNAVMPHFGAGKPPKIYIISSLAGGTGAGMFIDVSIAVSKFMRDTAGAGNHLQAIVATADSFRYHVQPIYLPNIYANTYGSLKTYYHLLNNSEDVSFRYEGYRQIKAGMQHMPNPIYLLTTDIENGTSIVRSKDELKNIIIAYLNFEIQSPLETADGQPKVQDAENEQRDQPGNEGMKKAFSSFGTIRFGIPKKEIEKYFSQLIHLKAINIELQATIDIKVVYNFIQKNRLGEFETDQLQEAIRTSSEEDKSIDITVDIIPKLAKKKNNDLLNACAELTKDQNKKLEIDYKVLLNNNKSLLLSNALVDLNETVTDICKSGTIVSAIDFLSTLREQILTHYSSLKNERVKGNELLGTLRNSTQESINSLSKSILGGFWGRKTRINSVLSTFQKNLELELNQKLCVWSMEFGEEVYNTLLLEIGKSIKQLIGVKEALEAKKVQLEKEISGSTALLEGLANIKKRAKGNRFSIVNISQILDIYDKMIGIRIEDDIVSNQRKNWRGTEHDGFPHFGENRSWFNDRKIIVESVINELSDYNLITALNQFYSRDNDQQELFTLISTIGSPLFPIDAGFMEPAFSKSLVLAIHPDIRDALKTILLRYIPADAGHSDALNSNKNEVIIYFIQHGYTPHSLRSMRMYFDKYSSIKDSYKKIKSSRPYHAWPNEDEWQDLIPISQEDKEIRKWFAIGRAFSYLFPSVAREDGKPDPAKNESFIYARGNYYYLNMVVDHKQKKIKLGNGLRPAIEKFAENQDYQDHIESIAETTLKERGVELIRKRLVEEYMPVLEKEIEIAQGSDDERAAELEELDAALREFVIVELKSHLV